MCQLEQARLPLEAAQLQGPLSRHAQRTNVIHVSPVGYAPAQCLKDSDLHQVAPNSNAVGMVGFLLGGGSSPFNGIHGLAADNIMEIRIITADGRTLCLSPSSTGAEGDLFAALRGAGHGLGVITSVTMPTFPISSLNLNTPDNGVWVRRVIFPLAALDHAAAAFLKILKRSTSRSTPKLLCSIMFLRAPPGSQSPQQGEPVISLAATYYGQESDAKQCAEELFDSTLLQHSINATSLIIPLHKMNDATEFLNVSGGYKQLGNALLSSVDLEGIREGVRVWSRFGDAHPDAKPRTIMFWGNWSALPVKTVQGNSNMFLPGVDRTAFLQVIVWHTETDTTEPAIRFMEDMLQAGRRNDNDNGIAAQTLPNNQLLHGKVSDVYSSEAIREIGRVKALWDGEGLFWSPAIAAGAD